MMGVRKNLTVLVWFFIHLSSTKKLVGQLFFQLSSNFFSVLSAAIPLGKFLPNLLLSLQQRLAVFHYRVF